MTMTRTISKTILQHAASLRLAIGASALLALGGCASVPDPPSEALQAAELAIAHAEQARIQSDTSPELRDARLKLAAARSSVEREEMLEAERLAHESRASAELAFAKAEARKAAEVNADMQESTDALEVEMKRNEGSPQ